MDIICFGDSNTYGYDPRGYFGGRYDADCRWVDILAVENDVVMKPIEDDVDRQLLLEAMEKLDGREKQIITMRFGLDGRPERTQKEVADLLGISQSYISRLEKRIISRLKKEILKML